MTSTLWKHWPGDSKETTMREIRLFIAELDHVGRAVLKLLAEPSSPRVRITTLADSSGAV